MRMLRRVGINVLCHLGIGDAITQIILGYIRHDISLSYSLPKAKEICILRNDSHFPYGNTIYVPISIMLQNPTIKNYEYERDFWCF